jgi:hypothetical protein
MVREFPYRPFPYEKFPVLSRTVYSRTKFPVATLFLTETKELTLINCRLFVGFTAKETPLPVGLDDLLKAEENGRWWIVGSAWVGAGDGNADESTDPLALSGRKKKIPVDTHNFEPALLSLAKKAKMNTELRRTIFCLMMSAEVRLRRSVGPSQTWARGGMVSARYIYIRILRSLT